MNRTVRFRTGVLFSALLTACAAHATTARRLSLDEMTSLSEMIISGEITSSFAAWDGEHKYIWTHYIVAVDNSVKGAAARTLEIAEPGGVIGIIGMNIGGATGYAKGEHVLIFLERMPNGYLRTAGLGQGKYGIDAQGRLHGIASLDGMTVTEATTHIAANVRATAKGVR